MLFSLKQLVVSTVLVLSPAMSVSAGQLEDAADAAFGKGDYATALQLLRPLADQGNVNAQFDLAVMYNNGLGVPQSYAEAARWYRLAAEKDHVGAQFNLGRMYATGEGVPLDYTEAVKWYRLAADQGDPGAENNLGVMYALGRGVPQNDILAHVWLNLAAAQGERSAAIPRDVIAQRMTPAQLAEAQKLACQWKPTRPLARRLALSCL